MAMNTGTRIGTRILIIAPLTNEYTAISAFVALSTIGRLTSMADAPGGAIASTKPIFFRNDRYEYESQYHRGIECDLKFLHVNWSPKVLVF